MSVRFLPYRLFSSNLLGSTLDLTSSQFIEDSFSESTLRKALVNGVVDLCGQWVTDIGVLGCPGDKK